MSKTKTYPFSTSLKEYFKKPDTPLKALSLIRELQKEIKTSATGIEVIIFVSMSKHPVSIKEIVYEVDHVCEDHIVRLCHQLAKKVFLIVRTAASGECTYVASPYTLDLLKSESIVNAIC